MIDEAPTCPKCGRDLHRGPKSPGGKVRWTCRYREGDRRIYCYSTTSPEAGLRKNSSAGRPRVFKRKFSEGAKVYIITSAQNATPIHEVFFACLRTMAKHRGAELVVIPYRYKNPTSRWSASQANEDRWAPEVVPHLWNVRKMLAPDLALLADVPIQPTASKPLDGFDGISGTASGIFGHSKLELRCIATGSTGRAKIMTTTGACTVQNYTDSKAGKLGSFHHTLGAVVVEVGGPVSRLRQLNFDNQTQSFTDLDVRYYEDRVTKAPPARALIMGDTHVDFISPDVERATFGPRGMIETLRPAVLAWHDVLDSYSVNPHHRGRPFISIAKEKSGRNDMEAEVRRACEFVRKRTPATADGMQSIVVPSNHDDMFDRWLDSHDWKTDPKNAVFYLRMALATAERADIDPSSGAIWPAALPLAFPSMVSMTNIRTITKTHKVAGIEIGMHGDRGPKGARGSILNHRRLGVKCFIGHSHSPGIEEGAYQVGTSTDLLEYAKGPNDWRNCHGVINADGKRQLIFIDDGEWRAT